MSDSETHKLPVLALSIALLLVLAHWSGQVLFDHLVFDRNAIGNGEWWRLLTGHFVHTDWDHLTWNLLAFLILGSWLETHSRRYLIGAIVLGCLLIDMLLMGGFSPLQYYCGLSGVLNAFAVVGLWLHWLRYPGWISATVILLYAGKNLSEAMLGESLLTDPGWAAFVPAHFAGALAGMMLLIVLRLREHDAVYMMPSRGTRKRTLYSIPS